MLTVLGPKADVTKRRWRAGVLALAFVATLGAGVVPAMSLEPQATEDAPSYQPGQSATDAAWGRPVRWDDFNGQRLGTGWYVYNSPHKQPPRMRNHVQLRSGELQIIGEYDRATGYRMSGGLEWDAGTQMYGRWEIKARTDVGTGFEPAILLWPKSLRPENDGEIDIIEQPWGDRQTEQVTLHNGPQNVAYKHVHVDATQWHVYAVDWEPWAVSYYIDGQMVARYSRPNLVPKSSPMYLAIQNDTAYTNCWVKCPNATTPAQVVLHVDWVRMYRASASQ